MALLLPECSRVAGHLAARRVSAGASQLVVGLPAMPGNSLPSGAIAAWPVSPPWIPDACAMRISRAAWTRTRSYSTAAHRLSSRGRG